MNSLIQSLFMTPEFRRATYNWSFEEWFKMAYEEHKKKQVEGIFISNVF